MSPKHTPGPKIEVRLIQDGPTSGMWSVVLVRKGTVYGVTLLAAGGRIGASISTNYWLHSRGAKSARPCTKEVKPGALYEELRRAAVDAAIAKRDEETASLRAALEGKVS